MARHVGRSKLGSKPVQHHVRLSLRPLGQQAYHIGYRNILKVLLCSKCVLRGYKNKINFNFFLNSVIRNVTPTWSQTLAAQHLDQHTHTQKISSLWWNVLFTLISLEIFSNKRIFHECMNIQKWRTWKQFTGEKKFFKHGIENLRCRWSAIIEIERDRIFLTWIYFYIRSVKRCWRLNTLYNLYINFFFFFFFFFFFSNIQSVSKDSRCGLFFT